MPRRGPGSIRRRQGASRYKSCTAKTSYCTMQSAENAALRYEENNPGCLPREAYQCPYKRGGLHFHFGKPVGRSHYKL